VFERQFWFGGKLAFAMFAIGATTLTQVNKQVNMKAREVRRIFLKPRSGIAMFARHDSNGPALGDRLLAWGAFASNFAEIVSASDVFQSFSLLQGFYLRA